MHFVMVCLAMVASLAAGVLIQPVAAAGPMVLWLVVMTILDWRKHNGDSHAARRGEAEEEG